MKINICKNSDKATPLESEHLPKIIITKVEDSSFSQIKLKYPHPMEKIHHLEWIKIYRNDSLSDRVNLMPGEKAEVTLKTKFGKDDELKILAKCSRHGFWQAVKNY